jgi:hypothetical protein
MISANTTASDQSMHTSRCPSNPPLLYPPPLHSSSRLPNLDASVLFLGSVEHVDIPLRRVQVRYVVSYCVLPTERGDGLDVFLGELDLLCDAMSSRDTMLQSARCSTAK